MTTLERDAEVELGLDALLHNWPRLVTWTDAWRLNINLREELTEALTRWQRNGERDADLLPKATAEQLASMASLSPRERHFLRLSLEREVKGRSSTLVWASLVVAGACAVLAVMGWMRLQDTQSLIDAEKTTVKGLRAKLADVSALKTRLEIELQQSRTLASDKSRAADEARRELDQKMMKSTKLSDELEITRERLRGKLIGGRRDQIRQLDALVSLAEMAATRQLLSESASGQLRLEGYGARRAKELKPLIQAVRERLKWYDAAVNSRHRKRDKDSLARFRGLRASLRMLNKRLDWAQRTADTLPRARTVIGEANTSSDPAADLAEASGTSRRAMLRKLKGDAEGLTQRWEKAVKAALRKPNRRAEALNELGLLAHGAKRFEDAAGLFRQATRYSSRANRRGVFTTNRVRALLSQAEQVTGQARIELLRDAESLLRRLKTRPPQAGDLLLDVHHAWAEAQLERWRQPRN